MKRPSFQFYPNDWRGNAKLRRCSWAARGAWIEVMGIMHDSDEYGCLRWPLKEIAQAIGAPEKLLRELVDKEVLKGSDEKNDGLIFTPRHAGQAGIPVTLIAPFTGPGWFCSRMVTDEYIRQKRGQSTRFTEDSQPPKAEPNQSPKATPKPTIGDGRGDGPTSTSTSTSKNTITPVPGFSLFWDAWPKTDRKTAKATCLKRWNAKGLETRAAQIVAHVESLKRTKSWQEGFEPAPLTYLNQNRFDDAPADGSSNTPINPNFQGAI